MSQINHDMYESNRRAARVVPPVGVSRERFLREEAERLRRLDRKEELELVEKQNRAWSKEMNQVRRQADLAMARSERAILEVQALKEEVALLNQRLVGLLRCHEKRKP